MNSSRIDRAQFEFPCLIENPSDLLYLTGLLLSKGKLLLNGKNTTLFVDGRYFEKAKKEAPCSVEPLSSFEKVKETHLLFDSTFTSYDDYLQLQKSHPHTHWIAKPHPLALLRAIKEPEEIELMQKAAELTSQGCHHIQSLLKEGVSEEDLALEFEYFCKKQGASSLSFSPIIAFGENGAYPHHRSGKTKLQKNSAVLMDLGAAFEHYCADMTRMVFFGKVQEEIMQLHEIVQRAKEKAARKICEGVLIKELDEAVLEEFEKSGVKQLYTHSLGHGVGIDVHEFPCIRFDGEHKDLPLQAGMVITIEPGLYKLGLGGCRLEDMFLVTPNGSQNFFS